MTREYKSDFNNTQKMKQRYTMQRQANFNSQFAKKAVIVKADENLLALDQNIKFRIVEDATINKLKKQSNVKYDAPILDS